MHSKKYKTVDEYLQDMPTEYIGKLQEIRNVIKAAVPEADEIISYNMPAYKYKQILVYFALSKKHIGFYPTPSAIEAFEDQLKAYKNAKGSVQFPLDRNVPLQLIADMAKFRFQEVQSVDR